MPYKERSLYNVFTTIKQKSTRAGISDSIIEDAKEMYKELSETKISRGSNRNGLIAACIYFSCKRHAVPRSAKEVAAIFGIKLAEMTKGCKLFIEIMSLNKHKCAVKASNPLDFIDRFCSNLNLPGFVREICKIVTKRATESSIVDENTPPSIAAGCIFLISSLCNLNIAKKTIAASCKISEVTISKCYKKLYIYRHKLIPKSAIEKYDIKMD